MIFIDFPIKNRVFQWQGHQLAPESWLDGWIWSLKPRLLPEHLGRCRRMAGRKAVFTQKSCEQCSKPWLVDSRGLYYPIYIQYNNPLAESLFTKQYSLVCTGKSQSQMDDFWGSLISGNLHTCKFIHFPEQYSHGAGYDRAHRGNSCCTTRHDHHDPGSRCIQIHLWIGSTLCRTYPQIGEFHGIPIKWMVYKGETPLKMDDSGVPPFMGSPHIRIIVI